MLEVLLCSLFTIVPDYLYRRHRQGKRFGHELTLYSVWYELRYGITSCLMLTVALIVVVFYNHPSTGHVTAYFRTVPVLPEIPGRVAEIYVGTTGEVAQGAPIFRLDSSKQQAALDVAVKRLAEVDAAVDMAKADLAAAEAKVQQAKSSLQQAQDELRTKLELDRRDSGAVARREIERVQVLAQERQAGVAAAEASRQSAETRISTLLPAEKATAVATREQAQVDLDKTVVRAGVSGRVEQFTLRVGDVVNPIMRPAGILIPSEAGKGRLVAGFGQIEAQVMKVGMIAEVTCISKPWTIIPTVVTAIQGYIAAGQVRAGELLIDPQQATRPGTITVLMEPLYENGLAGVLPGSSCIANAYSNNHEELKRKDIGLGRWLYLHVVDTLALVHALILRMQALILPLQLLVFSGGH